MLIRSHAHAYGREAVRLSTLFPRICRPLEPARSPADTFGREALLVQDVRQDLLTHVSPPQASGKQLHGFRSPLTSLNVCLFITDFDVINEISATELFVMTLLSLSLFAKSDVIDGAALQFVTSYSVCIADGMIEITVTICIGMSGIYAAS